MNALMSLLALMATTTLWAAPQSVNVPTSIIEKSYQRHSVTGDIFVDLIDVLQKMNIRLSGSELISVEFLAKTEELSASDIWLAVNGRMENSLLIARKDNESLTPRILTPLDRTAINQAALVFRGQTRLSQIKVNYNLTSAIP